VETVKVVREDDYTDGLQFGHGTDAVETVCAGK
jgi:hypothetical protein